MNPLKAALRQEYKKKRTELPPKEKLRLDDLMLLQLQRLHFGDVQRVLSYWPMSQMGEPNMHLYNGWLRHSLPGCSLAYTRMLKESGALEVVEIDEDTVYKANAYGVIEPVNGTVILPSDLDLIMVPLLVCNAAGYRVGYGKGYYDRLLNQCREDAVLLGFSYFEPVDQSFEEDWDIPLHVLVTPQEIHHF